MQQSHAPNTSSPELLGFGKGTKHRPNRESAPLRTTRVPEPEQLGRGSAGLTTDGSRRSNLEPEQRGQGGYTRREPGSDPVWLRHCEHTPVLFAASLPPHSATEQVSLKKKKSVLHRPLCVRAETRHLKRPGNRRIYNRGNCLGSYRQ